MGDEITAQAVVKMSDGIDKMTDAILDQNSGDKQAGELEGITPVKQGIDTLNKHAETVEEILGVKGWFHSMLEEITGHNDSSEEGDKEARDLQQSVIDSLGDMINFNEVTNKETSTDKKKKGKVGTSTKFDDLKDLPWAIGTLGAVLANTITNKDKDKKGGGGISGFFKGLMEGVGGIAALGVALLAFAGAALIFNFVDWGKAVVGMLAFTVFVIGMVALSKALGKEQENLIEFSKASLIMSAALGVFAISLWLISAVVSSKPFDLGPIHIEKFNIGAALVGIGIFALFELGMVGLAKLLGNSTGDFTKFALGSMIMTGAMVTFAIALVIMSNIFANGINLGPFASFINGGAPSSVVKIDPIGALAGLVTFLAFEAGLALIAKLMGNFTGDFVKFAVGSLIMTGALVAFTLALIIVSGVMTNGVDIDSLNIHLPKVEIGASIIGLTMFLGFLLGFVVIANVANGFMGQIALFSAVSMLMSVSLMIFSFALIAAGIAAFGGAADLGPLGHFEAPEGIGFKALAAIPLMAGFIAAFAAMGAVFLIPFAGAAMLAGITIASGILLAIGSTVIVMAKAMALAGLITTGGEMEWEGKKFTMIPMDESKIDSSFNPFFTLMDKVVDMGKKIQGESSIFPWKSKPGVNVGAIRMVGSVAEVIAKVAECIAESMMIKQKVIDSGAKWDVHVMDGALDYVLIVMDKLALTADKMGWWAMVKMRILEAAMFPIIEAMDKICDVIEKALTMPARLRKQGINVGDDFKIDPKLLNGICDPVMQVLLGPNLDGEGGLAGAGKTMKVQGGVAVLLMAEAMLPITEAISNLVGCIEQAATLGGKGNSARELIDEGLKNISYLMVGDVEVKSSWWSGTKFEAKGGFVSIFNIITKVTDTIKKGIKESLEAMKNATDALASVLGSIETVTKKKDSIKEAGDLFYNLVKTFGTRKTYGTLYNFFQTYWDENWKEKHWNELDSSFTAMKKAVASMVHMLDSMGDAHWVDAIKKCAGIPSLNSFAKNMDEFDDGMNYYAKAYDRIKKIPNSWIDNIGTSLQKIDDVKLDSLDKMAIFSEKASALGKTADQLDRIANAFKKINNENKQNALAKGADALANVAGKILDSFPSWKGKNEGEDNAQAQNVPKGQELAFIAKTIAKWDNEGVKVYGLGEKGATKEKAIRTLSV